MRKFTNGPWTRIGGEIGTPKGGKLAMVCVEDSRRSSPGEVLDRMEPNARLIVEAPVMYELLRRVAAGNGAHADVVMAANNLLVRVDGEHGEETTA